MGQKTIYFCDLCGIETDPQKEMYKSPEGWLWITMHQGSDPPRKNYRVCSSQACRQQVLKLPMEEHWQMTIVGLGKKKDHGGDRV